MLLLLLLQAEARNLSRARLILAERADFAQHIARVTTPPVPCYSMAQWLAVML
jgi:hypothetical protein